jgi:hypothetical protein
VSACDRCYAPGACCKRFSLGSDRNGWSNWVGDGQKVLIDNDLPFVIVDSYGPFTDSDGCEYEVNFYGCPKLGADGRCTIYDSRPKLCRDFTPLSTGLCVHFGGSESGDGSAEFGCL